VVVLVAGEEAEEAAVTEEHYGNYWKAIEQADEVMYVDHGPEAYFDSMSETPREFALLYAAHVCQEEVSEGGLEQFFFSQAGVVGPEALEGFQAIGQESVALLLKGAMEKFGEEYPRERLDRVAVLDDMDGETAETLMALEENLLDLIGKEAGGFEAAADRYAASILGEES
jgi:hypothetical protein